MVQRFLAMVVLESVHRSLVRLLLVAAVVAVDLTWRQVAELEGLAVVGLVANLEQLRLLAQQTQEVEVAVAIMLLLALLVALGLLRCAIRRHTRSLLVLVWLARQPQSVTTRWRRSLLARVRSVSSMRSLCNI
jgi:hypothetical protein